MKGPKRFVADLAELRNECKEGMVVHGLMIKDVLEGEDEGSLEFGVFYNGEGPMVAILRLLVSDTADYPTEHSFFSFGQGDLSSEILEVIEAVCSQPPYPLKETVVRLVTEISKSLGPFTDDCESDDGWIDELISFDLGQQSANDSQEQQTATGSGEILKETFDIPSSPLKTTNLKGRKRFLADFAQLQDESKEGLPIQGLVLIGLRPGDEEGAVQFRLLQDGEHLLSVNFLLSDTTEYPKNHTCIAFSDEVLSPEVTDVIDNASFELPYPLRETVIRLICNISLALGLGSKKYEPQAQDEEEEFSDSDSDSTTDYHGDFDDLDNKFETTITAQSATQQMAAIRRDFLEIVSAGYRPGVTRWSHEEFVISVSLSVLDLKVPTAALAAWDRRLLSTHQHLTLLISGIRGSYPILRPDGSFTSGFSKIKFSVGLSPQYKPSKDVIAEVTRNFAHKDHSSPVADETLITSDPSDPADQPSEEGVQTETAQEPKGDDGTSPAAESDANAETAQQEEEDVEEPEDLDPGRFQRFTLSSSLEGLLNQSFVDLIKIRLRFDVGWAGAETILADSLRTQKSHNEVYSERGDDIRDADIEETTLSSTYSLPPDPLMGYGGSEHREINFPLVAYCYLIRRLTLCSLYCLICHQRIKTDFVALKPYVCDSKLCAYQFYAYGFGPSIEHEVQTNPDVVDLLVSLAYVSATGQQMDEGFPIHLGLRVPAPKDGGAYNPGEDGLVGFDTLSVSGMRMAIIEMIDSLPKIPEMRKFLRKKALRDCKKAPILPDMNPDILPAAWMILRWIIASSTAHIELLDPDERIAGIDATYKQFRFSVGSPDAENKFSKAVAAAKGESTNANTYPSLYAFHGSPLKNWHSIIRQGLLIKAAAHGRAYGNGVYFARDGSTSMGYSAYGGTNWKNSSISPQSCLAIAEIVNLPHRFVCSNPYFVVNQTTWIMTRYLLVASAAQSQPSAGHASTAVQYNVPTVSLDPAYPLSMQGRTIGIPEHSHKLSLLLEEIKKGRERADYDIEDSMIFSSDDHLTANQENSEERVQDRPVDDSNPDWKHDPQWTSLDTFAVMSPPTDATRMATMTVQRELTTLLNEQQNATSLRELGFYMPPELMSDNLFQWMVEMHSFDPTMPIAQDMREKGCNSILFEIRFPSTFPHAPPFFRVVKPRFLSFFQGGGGHVTGGGSICIDLLTSDGWLPSYSMSAILLQIRMAITNPEPRPARLASNWNQSYGIAEAMEGFKRTSINHGWKVRVPCYLGKNPVNSGEQF